MRETTIFKENSWGKSRILAPLSSQLHCWVTLPRLWKNEFLSPVSLTIWKPTKSTKEKHSNDCKKEGNSIINNCKISFEISKRRWDQIKIIWNEWKWWKAKKIHVIRIPTGSKRRTKSYKKMAVTKASTANPYVGKKVSSE